MPFNLKKLVHNDRNDLLFAGFFFSAVSIILLFLHFNKEQIESSKDITFINGSFDTYNWVDIGAGRGSSLTFKLQNYTNKFKIKADFFQILQKEKFKSLSIGEPLTIGISNAVKKYLNTPYESLFAYSIVSNNFIYLDLKDTIKKHNSALLIFAAGFFAIGGCTLIFFSRKSKAKMAEKK